MHHATCDAIPQLSQPRRGYRFSGDAVALAEFAKASATETVLDLCSGCGVVPILMWQRSPFRHAVGVELDAELSALARNNVAEFRLDDKITMVQADVRSLRTVHLQGTHPFEKSIRFDVITANPPYWPAHHGRLNPNAQKAVARHEISLTLAEVLAAARRFLKPGGRFYLSHLESRQDEILARLTRDTLAVCRVQQVSGLAGRMLFEAHLQQGPNARHEPR